MNESDYPPADPDDLETVRVAVADRVATLTVDRPEKRNALSSRVKSELRGALGFVLAETDARAVVLTGAGETAFVAGADVAEFADATPTERRRALAPPDVYEYVERFPRPVVAAVNGYALGGGCELAMACDVRVAAESARLGQPEIRLGIVPGGGGTQRLPRLVGEGVAMDLVLTGRLVDAAEAREIGLVDRVVPDADLDEAVADLAGEMAEKSPLALQYAKECVLAAGRLDREAGRELEVDRHSLLFASHDAREGIAAFLEERTPEFTGE